MPLEKIGKYERLDVLGHGASGIVYLAKDTLLGKQVALKEISAQGDDKERFLEEARVLDRLRHPNIVQVNSVDEIGGRVIIDMEYVKGRNLQEVLRETPTLPVADAVSIAAQICDGLAYAHSQRTVHRDIKPANILLTHSGRVKLVDFGLAEVLGTHSLAGGAGTYAYMAPEDFHPEQQSDRQSDIWAVGVILYEMLAGRRPFQVAKAKDPFAWKTAIEADPIVPLHALRPEVSPELEVITARALARDKAARYKDAGEMASDLRGLGLEIGPGIGYEPGIGNAGLLLSESRYATEDLEVLETVASPTFPLPASGFLATLPDVDTFLARAPDHWNAARDALEDGSLSRWLRGLGEEPLAAVADEVAGDAGRSGDDKLRDFLYRAGLDTADEARRDYKQAQHLEIAGDTDGAEARRSRAARLDPRHPEYFRPLTPAPLALPAGDAGLTLSRDTVDFGVLRRGKSRQSRITLQNSAGGAVEGRVSAAPGWVRVEPSAFSARRRQTLTLTTETDTVWAVPASYADTVTLETPGGRREIAVRVQILPARLGWGRIFFWYWPLLVCAGLPVAASVAARSLHPPVRHIQQPGFTASGLLFLSAFVLSWAADIAWVPRLLPLGLSALVFWRLSLMPSVAGSRGHLIFVQAVTPVLMLLVLQTCAFFLDAKGWGNWKIWRWIAAAVGLLVGYSLLHSG